MKIPEKELNSIIRSALKEDIGTFDVTTHLTVDKKCQGKAVIFSKEPCVICGAQIARKVFSAVDKNLKITIHKHDGQQVKFHEKVLTIEGSMRAILIAERVAVNFLSLLSGVASTTNDFVKKVKNTKVKILDTRKTTPNLRSLEKYAVTIGGGHNHRMRLDSAILIKDNHLAVTKCADRRSFNNDRFAKLLAKIRKQTNLLVEVETETLQSFKGVIAHKPDIVMLDNFTFSQAKEAVAFRNKYYPQVKLEISGGIKLDNVACAAKTGADYISIGSLTHSPKSIDFSLEISET